MPISKNVEEIIKRSSWIRRMFEAGVKLKAEKGAENVYDFSLGNPILEPPKAFYEVLAKIAEDHTPGGHGYMPNPGYPDVRAKVAAHLKARCGIELDASGIVMTVGAGGALNVLFKAIMDPGAEVVVPAPYFVEYDFYAGNHGGQIKRVPTGPGFTLDVQAIEDAISENTCAVLINTPNNPTGTVYKAEELDDLAAALTRAGEKYGKEIYLISDEPYRQIIFDGLSVPYVFNHYKNTIMVTSFSKDLSLAGDRIGYIAVHPDAADLTELMAGLALTNRILGFVNAPGVMQKIVGELLEEASDMGAYAKKRELICDVLDAAGFEYNRPGGTFYVFPKSPIEDDVAFVKDALNENLLLVPGSGFQGPGYFRIAFCCADDVIERSADAFKKIRAKY